jgi:cytidylate kinase
MMPVVTVSRQFGAGGSSVARIVADRLGAELVDGSVIAEVARRLQLPESEVASSDERPEAFVDRLLGALRYLAPSMAYPWRPPGREEAIDPRSAIVNLTQELIHEAARVGQVVVVGRGGAFVLRDHPNALHVSLHASEEVRLETIMSRFAINAPTARRRMRKTDADRAAYIRQLYGAEWQDSAHYDLVIDTGRLGYECAADVIVAAIGRGSPRLRTLRT